MGLGLLGLFETSNRLGDRLGWLQKKTWRFHRLRWTLMALLVAVMLFCVLPMAKSETPPSLRLHGVVTDVQTGKPIPGASVRTNVQVFGNFIGTTADGTAGVANSGSGILITTSSRSNIVGGVSAGAANLIAFNSQDGIAVPAANANTNNTLRGNIFSNGDLGIDLGTSNITGNDNGDADVGANQLQNFPVLTAVTNTPTDVIIVGSLNSRPSTPYALDFYSNIAFDNSGSGEGRTWLGATNLTTAADSNVDFAVSFPRLPCKTAI